MTLFRTATVMALAAALVLTLGACREEEQNRRLTYEPGVYKGKADTPISAEAKRSLRTRVLHQNALAGGSSGGGGGAPASSPPDVRPPSGAVGGAGSGAPLDALRRRVRQQNFN
jgi:hypothetical protein